VIEVIEDEDEDEVADEDADEDAEVEEVRAASPQGDWLASDGEASCVESDEDSWDKESFTSSSDISESDETSLLSDTPGRPTAAHVRRVLSDDEE